MDDSCAGARELTLGVGEDELLDGTLATPGALRTAADAAPKRDTSTFVAASFVLSRPGFELFATL